MDKWFEKNFQKAEELTSSALLFRVKLAEYSYVAFFVIWLMLNGFMWLVGEQAYPPAGSSESHWSFVLGIALAVAYARFVVCPWFFYTKVLQRRLTDYDLTEPWVSKDLDEMKATHQETLSKLDNAEQELKAVSEELHEVLVENETYRKLNLKLSNQIDELLETAKSEENKDILDSLVEVKETVQAITGTLEEEG